MKGNLELRLGKRLRNLPRPGPREFVLAFAVLYAVLFAALSVYKHEIYASARFDLGNMDQAVWNSSYGRILEATDEQGNLTSRLRNHTDFLLLAFVPLYWITPSPYWLLIVQAAVVGAGAIPLYWLSKRFLAGRAWPAAFISVAYLFNPGLQSANLFDFHAQTMAGALLLFAFHYLLERRLLMFLIFGVLAAMAKEEISLLVAMMGVYVVVAERRWRWGVPVFVGGTAYFLLAMLVIIPAFNAGDASRLVVERYEGLGGSLGGLVRTMISDPLRVIGFMLTPEKITYLLSLLGLAGFLGLLAPLVLTIPLPELAINLLSDRPQMVDIHYHYSAPIIPFVYLASAAGLARLARWAIRLRSRDLPLVRRLRRVPADTLSVALPLMLALWILLFSIYVDFNQGPIPYARFRYENPVVMRPLSEPYVQNLDEAVALIPDDARVSASNWIGPHLAHRRHLYLFPIVKDADYVVVDMARPTYYTEVNRDKALDRVRKLLDSPEYEIIYAETNVVVFERTG